jgi:hypothetical protein
MGRIALAGAVAIMAAVLVGPAAAAPQQRDLDAGLAYLRAGAQAQAEEHLARYRNETRDPEVRHRLGRVLPLLKRPLTDDVREFLAAFVEEGVRLSPTERAQTGRAGYLSRSFPVFP